MLPPRISLLCWGTLNLLLCNLFPHQDLYFDLVFQLLLDNYWVFCNFINFYQYFYIDFWLIEVFLHVQFICLIESTILLNYNFQTCEICEWVKHFGKINNIKAFRILKIVNMMCSWTGGNPYSDDARYAMRSGGNY